MNSLLKKIIPLAKSDLFLNKHNVCQSMWHLLLRHRHEDAYFMTDKLRELEDPDYGEISHEYLGVIAKGHRTFIIQPYIKWGKEKKNNSNADLKLAEAIALIRTLPYWTVIDTMLVPLLNLDRKQLVGSGNLEKIKQKINCEKNISAIFVSINTLKHVQILELEKIFGLPVFDRYSIVIHIFRSHAMSPEAKLQVAIAEIPYIYKKMSELSGRINLLEKRKLYLQARESKLRSELKKIHCHRQLIRNKRKNYGFPTVAIVGYTNAGKTSLIKALTGDEKLIPKNYLFATLDTTAHAGILPCKMNILYIDTIGFIQDVPETLIEPFITTLEDALFADLVVHVYDASHPDKEAQIDHVRKTLATLIDDKKPLIEVANKYDLLSQDDLSEEVLRISATKSIGINILLNKIQKIILSETGRSMIRMRVQSGSNASSWLYKEATVVNAEADSQDPQFMFLDVIVTENHMHRFRRFLKEAN